MQRRDDVVVLLAVAVIKERFPRGALLDVLLGDDCLSAIIPLRVHGGHLKDREGGAGVAVREHRDPLKESAAAGDMIVPEPLGGGERFLEDGDDVVRRELLEHEHAAPREERAVDLERGVLGRGPDEDDAPLLHEGQEGVLLRLVEAVDLVDEDDGPESGLAPFLALAHHVADLLYAARDRREVDEFGLRHPRDDPGKRGLPGPGRPPENHGGDAVALDELPENHAFPSRCFCPA